MTQLVVFDLGETLVNYEGVPLNWSGNYLSAIHSALCDLGLCATNSKLELAVSILNFYNTRVNPRSFEVAESEVLNKVAKVFDANEKKFEIRFFTYFQRRAVAEDTALETLKLLKNSGLSTALLSDVPYGMPKKLLIEDLGILNPHLDIIRSSCEVGFRKPIPVGLKLLAEKSKCKIEHVTYVGNEEKDIKCAQLAGAKSILLTANNENYGQTYTVKKLKEILPILL